MNMKHLSSNFRKVQKFEPNKIIVNLFLSPCNKLIYHNPMRFITLDVKSHFTNLSMDQFGKFIHFNLCISSHPQFHSVTIYRT